MKVLMMFLLLMGAVEAADRAALIVRLDELIDDADNRKMSAVNKVIFLNVVVGEYGARGAYVKRDTIITVADQELYSITADFAGTILSAYVKKGQERRTVPVMSRENVNFSPDVPYGKIAYVYLETDSSSKMGVHNLPSGVDSIVIQYYAFPEDMDLTGDECNLPDQYENALLYECASQILSTIPTAQAQMMSEKHAARAEMLFGRVHRPRLPAADVGVQP